VVIQALEALVGDNLVDRIARHDPSEDGSPSLRA